MNILVTGAGSPIGTFVCDALQARHRLTRWTSRDVDLLSPLSPDQRAKAAGVDAVLHLAWIRSKSTDEALRQNRDMLFTRFCGEAGLPPDRLYLLSSVSASPTAKSCYAQTKHRVAQELLARGGTAIVCGLVTSSPPFGPFRLFRRMANLPVLLPRFGPACPAVYPVAREHLADGIDHVLASGLTGQAFALFDGPVPMDHFLRAQRQRAAGLALPCSARALIRVASLLRSLPPWTLWDKLLTFFQKDADYLNTLKPIPDWNPQ